MKLLNRSAIIFLLLILILQVVSCTSVRLRNANWYYDEYAFADAIKNYEKVLQKRMVPEAMIRLADCYRQTGNTVKSEILYSQVVRLPDALPVHHFYLAEALIANGKYEQAKKHLDEYLKVSRNDFRAQQMRLSCDSVALFFADTTLFEIQILPLNKAGTNNFSPSFYRSGIVFVSDRGKPGGSSHTSAYTGKEFFDLFYAKLTERGNWMEPEILRGSINGPFNEGPAVFSNDFNTVFFTRNDYHGTTVNRNRKNYNNLKIYKGNFVGGEWNISSDLPFNNPEYSTAHPALSSNGLTLYFVSDMPWGYGGMDIYASRFTNGNWSVARNLGSQINTNGNELFPFIQNDTVLFFSSDGHLGMGGLDIFQSVLNEDKWSQPENLGYPVNTSRDDFGFIIDQADVHGYFSSNRLNNTDKIFHFVRKQPVVTITHILTNEKIPQNASITFKIDNRDTTVSFSGNQYAFNAQLNRKYVFRISAPGFYSVIDTVSTSGKRKSVNITRKHQLKEVKNGEMFRTYAIRFEKGSALFKGNSSLAVDSVAAWLKWNPSIEVEVQVHTDARGNEKDNLLLSQKRAEYITDYLALQGIHPRRLRAKGMGESKILNQCTNGILCLEEDHNVNNRVEIVIISGGRK
jgi:outer membrane protein OmpA-like peptidoglycan-associated protein/tetratricopeptide (TPR) repeat protein